MKKGLGKIFQLNLAVKLSYNSAGQLPVESMTLVNRQSPVVNRTKVNTLNEITPSYIIFRCFLSAGSFALPNDAPLKRSQCHPVQWEMASSSGSDQVQYLYTYRVCQNYTSHLHHHVIQSEVNFLVTCMYLRQIEGEESPRTNYSSNKMNIVQSL